MLYNIYFFEQWNKISVTFTPQKKHLPFNILMRNMKKSFLSMGAAIILLSGCASQEKKTELTLSGLDPAKFETIIDGNKKTGLYRLTNNNGMEVCVTNFGGRIVSIMVPDKNGKMTDVVLGFDNINDYQNIPSDFGASIGRYANRINKGRINIDGQEIQLPTNNFGHCLHGGPTGWQYQVYEANQTNDSTIVLTMKSADGDNNFPGNVTANVTYTLTSDNAIDIKYDATTDKTTVINMTNHSYFNLSGDMSKPATDHIECSADCCLRDYVPCSGKQHDIPGRHQLCDRYHELRFKRMYRNALRLY